MNIPEARDELISRLFKEPQLLSRILYDYFESPLNVRAILKKYSLELDECAFRHILPVVLDNERECPYCGWKMYKTYSTQKQFRTIGSYFYSSKCKACGHTESLNSDSVTCECVGCRKKKISAHLLSLEKYCKESFCISDLHLETAIYLLALTKKQDFSSLAYFIQNSEERLLHSTAEEGVIFQKLINSDVMYFDEEPPVKNIESKNRIAGLALLNYFFTIGQNPMDASRNIDRIRNMFVSRNIPKQWDVEWGNVIRFLWFKVCLDDLLEYVEWLSERFSLHFPTKNKIKHIIMFGLERYSLANMYHLLWIAATRAFNLQKEKDLSKSHAANSIVYLLEWNILYVDRKKFPVRSYNRRTKKSLLLKTLMEEVLQLKGNTDELAFNDVFQIQKDNREEASYEDLFPDDGVLEIIYALAEMKSVV